MTTFKDKCLIETGAYNFRSAPYIVSSEKEYSYEKCHEIIAGLTSELARHNIGIDDCVGICCENSPEYIMVFHALQRIGAVCVLINTREPDKSIYELLKTSNCKVLITDKALLPYPSFVSDLLILKIQDIFLNHKAVEKSGIVYPDKPSTIMFTSGSSGEPKAVVHSYNNHIYSALGANLNIPLDQFSRYLLNLPLYHVAGLSILFRTALAGSTIVMSEAKTEVQLFIQDEGITHLSLVPAQLHSILSEEYSYSLESLQAVLVGGGPISSPLIETALRRELPLSTTYGSTESASQVTTVPPGLTQKLNTSGKPLKYRELKISEEGEILIKGECMALGYLNSESVNSLVDNEGWYHSGDLGSLDEDGYLSVVGRKDNMFISGGENIFPEEIEASLCRIEGIENAVVVPVDDKEFGQCPAAFIKTSSEFIIETNLIQGLLEGTLPKYKIPKLIQPWPSDLPKKGWKPDRKNLKKIADKG